MNFDKMIEENRHVVFIHATKYKKVAEKFNIDFGDLVGMGNIGLVKAAKRFNEKENATFQTFANRIVEGTIRNGIRDWGAGPKYTRTVRELSWKINKIDDWKSMSLKEIVEITGADAKEALEACSLLTGDIYSLDAAESDEDDNLHSLVGRSDSYDTIYFREFTKELSDKELQALELASQGYYQKEIGEKLGVSQVHAGRLINKNVKNKWMAYAGQ